MMQKRYYRLSKTGFTFVEVAVAAAIFAVVSLAIYSTFSAGLLAWKRAQQDQYIYQDVRLALDRMAQDLENAAAYFATPQADLYNFSGEPDKLSFYTLSAAYAGASSSYSYPVLTRTTYSLDSSRQTLQRLTQSMLESALEEAEEAIEGSEAIAGQVGTLKFSYCYESELDPYYTWKEAWAPVEGIPQGVRIELQLSAADKPVFTKYVFIPAGKKGPAQ